MNLTTNNVPNIIGNASDHSQGSQQGTDFDIKYTDIRIQENETDDQVICDVCLDGDDEQGNEIVICDLCLVGTHQHCYGGGLKKGVPKGDWFCDRCLHLKQNESLNANNVKCIFCPDHPNSLKGALKKINDTQWAHIICTEYMPNISYADSQKQDTSGKVPNERFGVKCEDCDTNSGATIRCQYKMCNQSFHVKCAVAKGFIRRWDLMRENLKALDYQETAPVFCKHHQQKGVEWYQQCLIDKKQAKKALQDQEEAQEKILQEKKRSKLEDVEVELFTPTDQSTKVLKKSKRISKPDKKITDYTAKGDKQARAKVIEANQQKVKERIQQKKQKADVQRARSCKSSIPDEPPEEIGQQIQDKRIEPVQQGWILEQNMVQPAQMMQLQKDAQKLIVEMRQCTEQMQAMYKQMLPACQCMMMLMQQIVSHQISSQTQYNNQARY